MSQMRRLLLCYTRFGAQRDMPKLKEGKQNRSLTLMSRYKVNRGTRRNILRMCTHEILHFYYFLHNQHGVLHLRQPQIREYQQLMSLYERLGGRERGSFISRRCLLTLEDSCDSESNHDRVFSCSPRTTSWRTALNFTDEKVSSGHMPRANHREHWS